MPSGQRLERRIVRTDVKRVRLRALLRPANGDVVLLERTTHLARRILHVTEEQRLLGADDDARRQQPFVHAVRAEVALRRGVRVRIHVDRVVRTRLHARLAADARVVVEVDQSVRPLVHRGDRAYLDARWIFAMVAAEHREVPLHVGERADFDVLHPRAEHADRNIVFGLARGGTGVTADAAGLIDDPGPTGHRATGLRIIGSVRVGARVILAGETAQPLRSRSFLGAWRRGRGNEPGSEHEHEQKP